MKNVQWLLVSLMVMVVVMLHAGCSKLDDSLNDGGDAVPADGVNINPDYVSIDWETTKVSTYDDSMGTYQIQFAGEVPDIHPGSIITIDRDTAVLYRFVTGASVSGNTLSVQTVEASLTDIFYDTEFTLFTGNSTKMSSHGAVFHPVAAYVLDGNGNYEMIDMTRMRKEDTRFTRNLWNAPLFNLDGTVLAEGDHFKLWLEKLNASLGVDLVMMMNFGGRTSHEVIYNMVETYRSKTMKVRASLVGTFDTEQKIRFDIWGGFNFTPGYDIWKHDLFRPVPIRFNVVAGPVVIPIVLVLRCDLFREVQASGSGEISAYMGFTDHAELSGGLEWVQSSGITPIGSFENTFNYTPSTVDGKGQIQAKVWMFPRIKVMLYDRIGPSFDLMPWMSDTIRGGFREETLGQSNDYCAWSIDHHAGLDYRYGISRNNFLFGYEVANSSDSTERRTWIDKKIYHSPIKVLHASGRPQGGASATVRFDVYDTNYITNSTYKTLFPQIVKFEAEGQLSSEYGIAWSGTVSVNWTPTGNDILYAKLYDQNGNVIAWDSIHAAPCDSNLTSGDWVDLGLPSGLLWATRNVGASSPTDYGNYYAWGETSPKSEYNLGTYQYYRCDNNGCGYTKYWNYSSDGYNGFTDGLTTLQLGDDAATANYGGRTPTIEEWHELFDNTTSQWVTINGVNGRCFTGSNGNSLFLPAAGRRAGSDLHGAGSYGDYWSSSLDTGGPYDAWGVDFNLSYVGGYSNRRGYGHTVRAVRQN